MGGSTNSRNADYNVTAIVVGAFLTVGERRIRQLCKLGMPRTSRGRYPLIECIRWYARYHRNLSAMRTNKLRDRKYLAQAAKYEAQTKVILREFVDKIEVGAAITTRANELRYLFQRLPASIARDAELSPEALEVCRSKMNDARRDFVEDMNIDDLLRRNESRFWRYKMQRRNNLPFT